MMRVAKARSLPRFGDGALYLLLAALVFGAWRFSKLGLFSADSDTGYWIGVAGGTAMLLLLVYPMRKRLRFMRGWGAQKWWFIVHMVLGIGGPVTILVHSTFRVGSLNAGVALYSMLIVATSGVIGRFLYVRIHRGLSGERAGLTELRTSLGFQHDSVRSRLHFAPDVEQRLFAFEAQALRDDPGVHGYLARLFVLPFHKLVLYWRCRRDLDARLAEIGAERGWERRSLAPRRARAREIVATYLSGVVRVAQFRTFERLFALWHVAHVPFIYLMVISAVVHVIAVHAY